MNYVYDVGDVAQITNPDHHWYPCLVVVNEVKSWGVIATCLIPSERGLPAGQAPIRLDKKDIEYVGKALVYWE